MIVKFESEQVDKILKQSKENLHRKIAKESEKIMMLENLTKYEETMKVKEEIK